MAITTRSGKLLSNKNSAGTKDEHVREQEGTEEVKSAPLHDMDEVQ